MNALSLPPRIGSASKFGYSCLGGALALISLLAVLPVSMVFAIGANDQQTLNLASDLGLSIFAIALSVLWFGIRRKALRAKPLGVFEKSIYFGVWGWALVVGIYLTIGWSSYASSGPSGTTVVALEGNLDGPYWRIGNKAVVTLDAASHGMYATLELHAVGPVPRGTVRPHIKIMLGNSVCTTESRDTYWTLDKTDSTGPYGDVRAYCEPFQTLSELEKNTTAKVISATPPTWYH
jgi:hypothetical protein